MEGVVFIVTTSVFTAVMLVIFCVGKQLIITLFGKNGLTHYWTD